jgi:hypothetical protein
MRSGAPRPSITLRRRQGLAGGIGVWWARRIAYPSWPNTVWPSHLVPAQETIGVGPCSRACEERLTPFIAILIRIAKDCRELAFDVAALDSRNEILASVTLLQRMPIRSGPR